MLPSIIWRKAACFTVIMHSTEVMKGLDDVLLPQGPAIPWFQCKEGGKAAADFGEGPCGLLLKEL